MLPCNFQIESFPTHERECLSMSLTSFSDVLEFSVNLLDKMGSQAFYQLDKVDFFLNFIFMLFITSV
jgi:hypothetical protein